MIEPFTVGDLVQRLQQLPQDIPLEFEGGLTFSDIRTYRDDPEGEVDDRSGPTTLAVILFAEMQADLSEKTRERIKVAFGHYESFESATAVAYAPSL